MREDLHTPAQQLRSQEQDAYVANLIKQHRERIDQIEEYWHRGGLTAEQVRRLLEDGQGTPKKG